MILTGLIHDLGKVLCLFGEPQWAVVGDTFPTGCPYSPKIVLRRILRHQSGHEARRIPAGQRHLRASNCGLGNVHLSWGHDEYLYHIVKDHLPQPAQYMIRYHSFYAWHRRGRIRLPSGRTRTVRCCPGCSNSTRYDLYSKNPNPPQLATLKPYYEDLLARYLPASLSF